MELEDLIALPAEEYGEALFRHLDLAERKIAATKIIMKSMLMIITKTMMIIIIQIKMNMTSIKNLKMSILIKKT